MPVILLAVVSMTFYAAQNVVIGRKLTGADPIVIVAITSGTVFLLTMSTLIGRVKLGATFAAPTTQELFYAVCCGVLLFVAENCFFRAYSAGASVTIMTTVPLTLPVLAAAITYAATREGIITHRVLASWALAAIAVYLIRPR